MKRLFSITIAILLTGLLFAQTEPVDFKKVKSFAMSEKYDQLFKRFYINDTTLSLEDYRMLYYGQAYRDNFQPYASPDSARALREYMNANEDSIDYREVIRYTHMILEEFPFTLEEIYLSAIAFGRLGEEEQSMLWFYKFNSLVKAILSSGDGRKEKTAIVVTGVPDEYVILGILGLETESQALTGKRGRRYDVMSLKGNEYNLKRMYFDINLFFGKGF
jgi:hypothetical protein